MTKYVILDSLGKVPAKLDKIIRTAIYDDVKIFDSDSFYEMFQPRSWALKRSVNLKKSPTGSDELAHFNMARKGAVYDAIRAHSTNRASVNITTKDIFTSLDEVEENLAKKIDILSDSGISLPKDLVKSMKKALSEYNFD